MPSSYSHRWTLDIFVSYEDNDSKVNRFTSILFAKLKQARIGSRDSHERSNNLFKAIRQARFALVVFSANYADSSQCLDDPVEILHRRGNSKYPSIMVIPIFHGMDSAKVPELRQKGKIKQALNSLPPNVKEKEWRRCKSFPDVGYIN